MSEKKGKNILFINGIFDGHFTGTVELVEELVALGHNVTCYILNKFEERLKHTGATVRTFEVVIEKSIIENMPKYAPPFALNIFYYRNFIDLVLDYYIKNEEKGKYDYLVLDRFFDGNEMNKIIQASNVIAIYTCFITEEPPSIKNFEQDRKNAYIPVNKKYNLNLREYVKMHYINDSKYKLMLTSKLLHPPTKKLDDSFYFIGPSIEKRPEDKSFTFKKDQNKKLIYISLGTIFNKNAEFFKKCIEAFKNNEKYQIIMAIGKKLDIKDLGEIPNNFLVYNYAPQPQILALTDLFICHGGINSINEGLLINKTPFIVIPQEADQFLNAKLIEKNEMGIALQNDSITPELLKDTVNNIFNNEQKYKAGNDKIIQSFEEARNQRKSILEKLFV